MAEIILFSIIGAIVAAPSGTYYFAPAYPASTTPVPAPPSTPPPPPPAATYTKTYYTTPVQQYTYHPIATYASYYNAAPAKPTVTGNLYSFADTQGVYKFSYNQNDGQAKEEAKSADGGITGQYSYVNPDGQKIELTYTAGKDGFRAIGSHLPVAPAVPELPEDLAKAYDEAYQRLYKAHEEARARPQTYDDGSYKPEPTSAPAAPAVHQQVVYKAYVPAPVYAYPVKSQYNYVAAPAPAPVLPAEPEPKPIYTSSSYSTNVGGEIKPAPIPVAVPVQYQAAPVKVKSAYEGKPY
ncbi:hypothetical protein CHUAL_002031 [Chamberlinius hualienensis]